MKRKIELNIKFDNNFDDDSLTTLEKQKEKIENPPHEEEEKIRFEFETILHDNYRKCYELRVLDRKYRG